MHERARSAKSSTTSWKSRKMSEAHHTADSSSVVLRLPAQQRKVAPSWISCTGSMKCQCDDVSCTSSMDTTRLTSARAIH
eukprot:4567895-Amphidinium_carterae.1